MQDTTSLLFVYRLDDPAAKMRFHLRELDPTRTYAVSVDDRPLATLTGRQLMEDGLSVDVPLRNSARAIVVAAA